MDSSTPCASSFSEDVECKSCVDSPRRGKLYLGHEPYICSNTEKTVDIRDEEDNLNVQGLGSAATVSLHHLESAGLLSSLHETLYQDERSKSDEARICQEFQSFSLYTKTPKTLSRSATFSCSEEVQSCSLYTKGMCELPCVEVQGQSLSNSNGPAYARSMSLPASVKLVSALKGGHEQNGGTQKMNLHVKWAAEVYDPPATSMSHILRSHHQRPKEKKKDHRKNKQNKSKSSRGMNSERKHTNHKITGIITDSHLMRLALLYIFRSFGLLARSSDVALMHNLSPIQYYTAFLFGLQSTYGRCFLDKCGYSDVEVLDFAVNGQESKSRSSFAREVLAMEHVLVAEISCTSLHESLRSSSNNCR